MLSSEALHTAGSRAALVASLLWVCNCQGDENCTPGQTCAIVSGHNYCIY